MKKYELTTPAAEYVKIGVSMVVGAAMLAFALVCWIAHHDWFCIPTTISVERRYWDEVYTRIAVCPIDEFAGLGEDAWKK